MWTTTTPKELGTYFWGFWERSGPMSGWDGLYEWRMSVIRANCYHETKGPAISSPLDYELDGEPTPLSDLGGYWWSEPVKFPPNPDEKYGCYTKIYKDDVLI